MARAAALALAMLLASCAEPDALSLGTGVVRAARQETGRILSVEISLENRGTAPVHLYYDRIDVRAGERVVGGLAPLRDRLRLAHARAGSAAEREAVLRPLAEVGVTRADLRRYAQGQREIRPGERVQEVLPLQVAGEEREFGLELTYHDDATDRLYKVRARFTAP